MRLVLRLLCIGAASFPWHALHGADAEYPVVGKVTPHFALDRAGLRVGDAVAGWVLVEAGSGARQSGVIRSPFDFARVETEQSQRGDLTLQVVRGAWFLHKAASTLRRADRFEPAAPLTRHAVRIADGAREPAIELASLGR